MWVVDYLDIHQKEQSLLDEREITLRSFHPALKGRSQSKTACRVESFMSDPTRQSIGQNSFHSSSGFMEF